MQIYKGSKLSMDRLELDYGTHFPNPSRGGRDAGGYTIVWKLDIGRVSACSSRATLLRSHVCYEVLLDHSATPMRHLTRRSKPRLEDDAAKQNKTNVHFHSFYIRCGSQLLHTSHGGARRSVKAGELSLL